MQTRSPRRVSSTYTMLVLNTSTLLPLVESINKTTSLPPVIHLLNTFVFYHEVDDGLNLMETCFVHVLAIVWMGKYEHLLFSATNPSIHAFICCSDDQTNEGEYFWFGHLFHWTLTQNSSWFIQPLFNLVVEIIVLFPQVARPKVDDTFSKVWTEDHKAILQAGMFFSLEPNSSSSQETMTFQQISLFPFPAITFVSVSSLIFATQV